MRAAATACRSRPRPGRTAIVGRMAVQASTPGTNPGWLVFALTNPTPERIVRWLVAPRYTLANSRVFWPELDSGAHLGGDAFARLPPGTPQERPRRHVSHQPRAGPDRDLRRRDELAANPASQSLGSESLSGEAAGPDALQRRPARHHRSPRHLPHGDFCRQPSRHLSRHGSRCLGGTDLFLRRFRLLEQAVPGRLANAMRSIAPQPKRGWRRASCSSFIRSCASAFGMAGSARCSGAGSPRSSPSSCSRSSIRALPRGLRVPPPLLIASLGTGLIAFLAIRGQDRALSLIPTWMLLIVWLFGAAMIVLGKLSGDIVVSGLIAGLVLILVLLGFTVTQFAFRSAAVPVQLASPGQAQMKSLAVDGSGSHVFQWTAGQGPDQHRPARSRPSFRLLPTA